MAYYGRQMVANGCVPSPIPTDVDSFAKYLDSMWRERLTNWNSSGDVFTTLTTYFNCSPNPYLAFLDLVDCLPDAAVDSPDTLHNCVWKHFCTWLEQRARSASNNREYGRGGQHRQQQTVGNCWPQQRLSYLTHDVLERGAVLSLKHDMKTFTTACSLFRFCDYNHRPVVEIFSQKVSELVSKGSFPQIATIFDNQISILSPSSLLDDVVLKKLVLYLIATNQGQVAKKILSTVTPAERVYAVASFVDSVVGASPLEQEQIARKELGDVAAAGGLSLQGMYSVATRLTKDLSIPYKYYPNITLVQLKGTAKFIFGATFGAEAEMDITTFREAIQDLAEMDTRFPDFIVKFLLQSGYPAEAYYFAEKFKLDEILTSSSYLSWSSERKSPVADFSLLPPSADDQLADSFGIAPPYQLPLPDDAIVFVDTVEKYRSALDYILSLAKTASDHIGRSVGIDTEWTPVHRPDRKQTISILQLALIDRVFIIDIENLSPKLAASDWQLLDSFFNFPDIKKLTYAFKSDLSMLKTSFPEAANLDWTKITSHVDIEKLTQQIWKTLRAVDCGPLSIYSDQVTLDATSTAIPASLTDVARAFVGRRVPKMYRLSNWSRRPLFRGQLVYAAIDAYCLLEIYREMSFVIASQRLKISPEMSMLRKGDVTVKQDDQPSQPSLKPANVRLLCDALLTDVGAYLKQLGFDVETVADKTNPATIADKALAEQRIVITVPHLSSGLTEKNPKVRVIGVPFGKLQEQADFVASRLNVDIDLEDNKPVSVAVDPIQRVQQLASRRREEVFYDISSDPNCPPHEPMFMARCRLMSSVTSATTVETQAVATAKKEAKKRAAANMIVKLTTGGDGSGDGVLTRGRMTPRSACRQDGEEQGAEVGLVSCKTKENNGKNFSRQKQDNFWY